MSDTPDTASTPNIQLYTLGGAFGMRNVSPFCLKAEMLLTHLELPFELHEEPDPRKAPKGKLPFAVINGETLADSEIIVQRIDRLTGGKVFGAVPPKEAAYGLGLTRLAEEHLYWIMVASRWLDDNWFPNVVRDFFHIAPALVRPLAAGLARRQVKKTYDLQGLGRHSRAEEIAFARRDFEALQHAVTGNELLFGSTPTVYDFAIAAVLTGIYDATPDTWLTPIAREYEGLEAYIRRVEAVVGVEARGNGSA